LWFKQADLSQILPAKPAARLSKPADAGLKNRLGACHNAGGLNTKSNRNEKTHSAQPYERQLNQTTTDKF